MYSPSSNDAKVCSLICGGVQQTRKPCERHGHGAAISKVDDQFVSGDTDFDGSRISFDGEGTHSTPP